VSDFDAAALALVRRAYARQMLAVAGVEDAALEAAFASVPRERFLGKPPWCIAQGGGHLTLARSDPVLAYQDVLFGLVPQRGINNGSPSLHARLLHHLGLGAGARVVHVGAGTGYYTALMAELVGPSGRIRAVELDPELAAAARENLSTWRTVEVVAGDGSAWPQEESDAVYVSFGVERPAAPWIERLAPGGRLILPLSVPTPSRGMQGAFHARHGVALLVTRAGSGFAARSLGPAYFVCAAATDPEERPARHALATAFERGGIEFVRSLRWRRDLAPSRSWFVGAGFSLCYDPPP
jgi:protein-L-isoaspartate(D-aspartate) O-methyltransferase